jgi:hypothetical protein
MKVILDQNYVVAWIGHHSAPSPRGIATLPTYLTLRRKEQYTCETTAHPLFKCPKLESCFYENVSRILRYVILEMTGIVTFFYCCD